MMEINLLDVKTYLRVDFEDDDLLITSFINSAKNICRDILRVEELPDKEEVKISIYYAVAYLYEHREEANHKDLVLTLRSLLFGLRKAEF